MAGKSALELALQDAKEDYAAYKKATEELPGKIKAALREQKARSDHAKQQIDLLTAQAKQQDQSNAAKYENGKEEIIYISDFSILS